MRTDIIIIRGQTETDWIGASKKMHMGVPVNAEQAYLGGFELLPTESQGFR